MSLVPFRFLADATVVLHLAFVLFVIFGGFFVIRRRGVAWLHLPAVAWGAWIEFSGWICPLTPLENWLRERGGGSAYSTGFVEHYIVPLVYPASLSRDVQWVLGAVVLLLNAAVYATVLRRRARR